MRRMARHFIALCMILAAALPVVAGLDESWDWPNDPATGQPRRKIRIKYGFPAGTKLGDKDLKDIMDEAVANWNSVKGQTGWEFQVVGATDEADVEVVTEDHNDDGGAFTEWRQDKDGKVVPGSAKVKFDPTPPGYDWDQAGKNKDDTKNPVSCAKHELSHLLRLDHQGGTRSVSKKLKDPQGKDTKDDDVTTVSADDIAEAQKTAALPRKKDDDTQPSGSDTELRVPTWPLETPEYPTPPDIPDIYMWVPGFVFQNQAVISLQRRNINSLPDPFLVGSGLHGRLIKGVEIRLQSFGEDPRIMPWNQWCLIVPYEGSELGYGHLFDVGDPDYGPVEELGIRPVLWDPRAGMWMPIEAPTLGGTWLLDSAGNRAVLYLGTHLLNAFPSGDPNHTRLLIALAAQDAPEGDALLVVPDLVHAGYGGTAIVHTALPAPPGGWVIDVISSDPFVGAPGPILIPEGSSRGEGSFSTGLPAIQRHTSMTATDGGLFNVDSFFDIFVEVSLTCDPASGRVGDTTNLRAELVRATDRMPLAGQPVLFSVDGDPAGVAFTDASGWATFPSWIQYRGGAGTRWFIATYLGLPGNYSSSMNWGSLECLPALTTLWALDRTGTIGESVVLRAYLRRVSDLAWLSGRIIDFYIDGSYVGSSPTNASGRSDLVWVIPPGPASRTIDASFTGDAWYDASSDSAVLTALFHETKMATFNRTARITDRTELKCRLLRLDNTPIYNKSIDFYVDGSFVISRPTNVSGYASYPFYDVPDGAGAGVRTILSDWVGDVGYGPCSKTADLTVLRAIPYIWVLNKTIPHGAIANLYAYFRRLYDYQRQIGKSVDFKIDGTWVQTVVTDGSGVARYLYPTVEPVGAHTITCEFAGDPWLDPGSGSGTLTIY